MNFSKNHWLYTALISISFIGSGCSTYQYVTLESDLRRDQKNYFVHETDSVRIKYSFLGANCPIEIEVFNKQTHPIYIDWRKSSLIVNEERFTYWNDESVINTNTVGSTIQWTNTFSIDVNNTYGILYKRESKSFIPPQSYVKVIPLLVQSKLFDLTEVRSKKVKLNYMGSLISKYSFPKEGTPLIFRSYLVISDQEDFLSAQFLDNQFWVSEIIKSTTKFQSMGNDHNQFYLRKANGSTVLIYGGLLSLTLLAGNLAD